jgi:hypothetical protein
VSQHQAPISCIPVGQPQAPLVGPPSACAPAPQHTRQSQPRAARPDCCHGRCKPSCCWQWCCKTSCAAQRKWEFMEAPSFFFGRQPLLAPRNRLCRGPEQYCQWPHLNPSSMSKREMTAPFSRMACWTCAEARMQEGQHQLGARLACLQARPPSLHACTRACIRIRQERTHESMPHLGEVVVPLPHKPPATDDIRQAPQVLAGRCRAAQLLVRQRGGQQRAARIAQQPGAARLEPGHQPLECVLQAPPAKAAPRLPVQHAVGVAVVEIFRGEPVIDQLRRLAV